MTPAEFEKNLSTIPEEPPDETDLRMLAEAAVINGESAPNTLESFVTCSISPDQTPTPEQLARIREAAKRPIVFDEDCPELTEEQLRRFHRVRPRPASGE